MLLQRAMLKRHTQAFIIAITVGLLTAVATAERVKDITTIKGVRSNPLQGVGLVVGLDGTGDDSEASRRLLASLMRRKHIGVTLTPDQLAGKNIATVWVTAELPAFARQGSKLDVKVAVTTGDASSLKGGILLETPLAGADGQFYAVASGQISTAGFATSTEKATIKQGHLTVGKIPDGAHVEREALSEFIANGHVTYLLRNPDFTTAKTIAEAFNKAYPKSARPLDAGTVKVKVPETVEKNGLVAFVSKLNGLQVNVDPPAAIIVINRRTGTIIVGEKVRISTVAIAHGSLTITTKTQEKVVQPPPFARGATGMKEQNDSITVTRDVRELQVLPSAPTVADLARALNAMGLKPSDIMTIFETLKEANALQAAEIKIQ